MHEETMTPEQEAKIAADHRELPEIQRKEFEQNETIKGLLTNTEEKCVTIKIGTITVKILAAPPRKLRRELIKYQRLCQNMQPANENNVSQEELEVLDDKLNAVESQLYPMLTEMVISPAELKDPAVWQYLDEKEGLAMTAFGLIMTAINEQGEDIKNSRKATRVK
jgi:hypothetical protein